MGKSDIVIPSKNRHLLQVKRKNRITARKQNLIRFFYFLSLQSVTFQQNCQEFGVSPSIELFFNSNQQVGKDSCQSTGCNTRREDITQRVGQLTQDIGHQFHTQTEREAQSHDQCSLTVYLL